MRSVLIITRHADAARFAPVLERAGFSTTQMTADRLADEDGGPVRDVAVIDFRDIPAAAFAILGANYADTGVVMIALAPEDGIERVLNDSPLDDFMVLPGSAAELVRRIERALWRRHGIDSENFVHCGALTIDLSNYRVTVDGEALVLTFKEYELLRFLAMNSGRVFTREQLLNRVWGYDYFGGARTVDVHIRRIRAKIEIHGRAFIETVRNVGYRLVAEARKDAQEE